MNCQFGDCRAARSGALAAAILVCWLAGCGGPSGPEQAAVTGTVTLDGQPITGGTINFMPLDEGGRAVSSLVQEGRYDIPKERGPIPGRYRVEISWEKPVGTVNEENPDAPYKREQVVPAKYNRESTLEHQIESGDNQLNFELTSK